MVVMIVNCRQLPNLYIYIYYILLHYYMFTSLVDPDADGLLDSLQITLLRYYVITTSPCDDRTN